jgi:VWFA-related protein
MTLKTLAPALVGLAASIGLSSAPVSGQVGQQATRFRAEANYVEVDAIVTDRQGHRVPGLTAGDFIVHEGDTIAPVETFDAVDLPQPNERAALSASPARLSPLIVAPDGALNGRIYLLYFDVPANGLATIDIRKSARDFITHYLQPGDVAAIWDAESIGETVTFTNDQAALLKAADAVSGGMGAVGARDSGDQSGRLRDAAEWLSGIQGRRKSLLLFTTGFPTVALGRANGRAESFDWLPSPSLRLDPMRMAGAPNPIDITGLADVHVYTVDVRGLVAPTSPGLTAPLTWSANDVSVAASQLSGSLAALSASTDALRSIADETGAVSLVDTNDFSAGFARIVDDNSHYYVLGYSSPRHLHDGRFMSIRVQMRRHDLTVRARKGYLTR